mgnify:FL=1
MTLYSNPTFFSFTIRTLRKYPDRVAFRQNGASLTYRELIEFIARVQQVFRAKGLQRGDTVAFLSENRADSWCVWIAAHGLGLSTTWLHPLGSLESQLFQVRDVDARALVIDADAFPQRLADLATGHASAIAFGVGRAPAAGLNLLALAAQAGDVEPLDLSQPDDVATLNYTGGTTGRQKGVVRFSAQVTQMAISMASALQIPPEPQYLAIAAISHVSGQLILPTFMLGGTVHLLRKFEVVEVLETLAREKIDMTLMVLTMIYKVLEAKPESYDLSNLKLVVYAGSVIAPERLAEALHRIGPVFSQIYAQTECTPITVMRKEEHDINDPRTLESCGYPVVNADVRILDDEGKEVPAGERGELCVRGPSVMQGYFKQEEVTRETLSGGWLHTGDIARADASGRLFIVDRKKDMIVSGGFNIYPREVEDTLATHPAINSAAVIGVPHPQWGESVAAIVVLRAGASATAEELIDHVKRHKGSLLAPKQISFAESLPVTPFGKVDKKALRAPFWSEHSRAVG